MRRAIPQIVLVAGYLCAVAGAALVDLRAGLVSLGLVAIYEAREAQR